MYWLILLPLLNCIMYQHLSWYWYPLLLLLLLIKTPCFRTHMVCNHSYKRYWVMEIDCYDVLIWLVRANASNYVTQCIKHGSFKHKVLLVDCIALLISDFSMLGFTNSSNGFSQRTMLGLHLNICNIKQTWSRLDRINLVYYEQCWAKSQAQCNHAVQGGTLASQERSQQEVCGVPVQ